MKEEMAVMRGVKFGCRDINRSMLYFTVYMLDSTAALICLVGNKAIEFIEKECVSDITSLEGAPCIVRTDGYLSSTVEFVGLFH